MERLTLSVNVSRGLAYRALAETLRIIATEIECGDADEGGDEVYNGCFYNFTITKTEVEDDEGSGEGADEEGSGEPDSPAV